MSKSSTGARALLDAAHAQGVRVCFANPGTTELGLVRALDDVPGIRPVLCLFEGVCTGAADGYARVSGSPALTVLHLGPGLANGLANLHNARRAHSPIINIVGDHATWHLRFDTPLTSDIESLARPVSNQVIRVQSSESIVPAMQRALVQARTPPGGVVTLVVPTDLMDMPHAGSVPTDGVPAVPVATPVPTRRIEAAARRVRESGPVILLLGSDGLSERAQRAAAKIANATGARLLMECYPAIVSLGGDLPRLERLAYFPDHVIEQLRGSSVVLAGARAPVSYFGYEGQASQLVPDDRLIELSLSGEDSALALEQLAEQLQVRSTPRPPLDSSPKAQADSATLSSETIADELLRQLPEGAIICLEGSTLAGPWLQRAHGALRHRLLTNTGGAIGQGLPCAVGAAIAQPAARVLCLQSDGGAQYTLQSLWTMARERLNVTVIVAANHRYGILQTELKRAGAALDQAATARLTRLESPRLNWVALAMGYGVPSSRVENAAEFHQALMTGLKTDGPYLIEAQLP